MGIIATLHRLRVPETVVGIAVMFGAMVTASLASDGGRSWPGFRGENRDGRVAALPTAWVEPKLLWQYPLPSNGVGGVAASDDFVVVSGRDRADQDDLFVCLDPYAGTVLWSLQYPAAASLDYGNSPRATPMIDDPWVFCLGASGHLNCIDLDTGEVRWKKHLVDDFNGQRPEWGYGGSPLLVGEQLIVQIGSDSQSIASLRKGDGKHLWSGAGMRAGYASPQIASWHGVEQIIAFDQRGLASWESGTGKPLWRIEPEGTREFHVPMPLIVPDGILTAGENRGLCKYLIADDGNASGTIVGQQFDLAPDMHSPVVLGDLVIGVHEGLFAIDSRNQMTVRWLIDDPVFSKHCSLMFTDQRLLVVSENGECLLVDITSRPAGEADDASARILGRANLSDGVSRCLAHPALVGDVLYVRSLQSISAWSLSRD